jgi:hypothetical protein
VLHLWVEFALFLVSASRFKFSTCLNTDLD